MAYIDGFVIPMPTRNLAAYRGMAKAAGKVWMEHGALQYCECAGDEMNNEWGVPFPRLASAKKGETVIFSWIYYRNKAHRNAVNKKVMADPRITRMMQNKKMPFDMKRMSHGGFKTIVDME